MKKQQVIEIVQVEQLLGMVVRPAAWAWMRERYLQSGPVCPGCGAAITGPRALSAWLDLRDVYCAGCGKSFAATVGTPIHGTSWQPEEFGQLLQLLGAGRTVARIAASLGKSERCVRDMIERLHLVGGVPALPVESASSTGERLIA
jgi:hypothetical protein